MTESRPPLRARLHRYKLSKAEFALLTAMSEAAQGGTRVWASATRLAAYAKVSRRHVDRLIHGYIDPRTGARVKGFLERGYLTQLAPPGAKKRTAIYQINEDALPLDPRMGRYLDQPNLPGLLKPPKAGVPQHPVSDVTPPGNWTPCPSDVDTVTGVTGHGVQSAVDTVSTDSKTFDSSTTDSKSVIRQRAYERQQVRPSASQQRAERSKRNILDGFAANARRRDAETAMIQPGVALMNVKCSRCHDTGLRPSYSKPGVKVSCECGAASQRTGGWQS